MGGPETSACTPEASQKLMATCNPHKLSLSIPQLCQTVSPVQVSSIPKKVYRPFPTACLAY